MTTRTLIAGAFALLLSALPAGARADDAAAAPSAAAGAMNAEAQEHYTAGRESYRLGLYGKALEAFERSLALAPSPNTRLYIARSMRELGRWSEAAEQYATTVHEAGARGGRYLATRDAANVELADVKVRLERATAATRADVSDRSDTKETARVDETTSAAGANAANPTSSAVPRAEAPAGAGGRRGVSAVTWISGGVAVAGTASFAVLYALASNRFGFLEESCTRVRTAACDDARTTGKAEEIGAYASLGVAMVAAAVTVYTLLASSPSSGGSVGAAKVGAPRREPWRIVF
jgi:tetratricopeptide (TPR) repeat protein